MPGPDSIPFGVWKALGEFGAEVLLGVAKIAECKQAEALFNEAYQEEAAAGSHHFNVSTLVRLPKEGT